MDPLILRFLLLLCMLCWTTQTAASEPVDLLQPATDWQPVLASLQLTVPIEQNFIEWRRNPFHRAARRFDGVLRWDPAAGLSLGYSSPTAMTLWIRPHAIVMARAGKTELLQVPEEQQELLLLFAKIFAWDSAWLMDKFAVSGQMEAGTAWRMDFHPLSEALGKSLSRIQLHGNLQQLQAIDIALPGGRSVSIQLTTATFPSHFSEATLREAYPVLDD